MNTIASPPVSGRQHVETGNLCANRDEVSVDLQFARTIAQGCAPRPAGLETGQEDRVAGVGGISFEMMQYPSARRHPAGRDNDFGHGVAIEAL